MLFMYMWLNNLLQYSENTIQDDVYYRFFECMNFLKVKAVLHLFGVVTLH